MTVAASPIAVDAACLRRLRAQAARLSRRSADVDDLVQDVLVAALLAGRADPAWLAGTLRRQAALAARGAGRRRRREADAGAALHSPAPERATEAPVLPPMPPSARSVARLALHGLGADEIRWLLRIPPQAFRQRLAAIRRAVAAAPDAVQATLRAFAEAPAPTRRPTPFAMGPARRVLKAALRDETFGIHDPDGHLLLVRRGAHVPPGGGNTRVPPIR